jgi:HSP20 family protein
VSFIPRKKVDNEKGDEVDLFDSFDDELVDMRERMDRIFEAFMRNELGPDHAPLVYGFSMQTGEDGEPMMQELGSTPEQARIGGGRSPEREPLIDVIESGEQVSVIVELPGVKKEHIRIEVLERSLQVDVDDEIKEFHERIELPCAILPDSIKANYKNGVLEILMTRVAMKKRARTVKVE